MFRENLIKWPTMIVLVMLSLLGCSQAPVLNSLSVIKDTKVPEYLIGPGDSLQIFVWRNAEVSTTVTVRPDGRISTPLVEDMEAVGKTPTQLARDIERELSFFLKEPLVTVIIQKFVGPYNRQIRVVGEATRPMVLPYSANMTLLDVMIAVGGLTEFASGNNASIVRIVDGSQKQYNVMLDSLIRDGNISANVAMMPGDILIIPESWF